MKGRMTLRNVRKVILRVSLADEVSLLKRYRSSGSDIASFDLWKGCSWSGSKKNHSDRIRIRNAGEAGVE